MHGGSPLRSAPGADRSGHGDAEPAGSSHRPSWVFDAYICSARLPHCACSLACLLALARSPAILERHFPAAVDVSSADRACPYPRARMHARVLWIPQPTPESQAQVDVGVVVYSQSSLLCSCTGQSRHQVDVGVVVLLSCAMRVDVVCSKPDHRGRTLVCIKKQKRQHPVEALFRQRPGPKGWGLMSLA